ncbi:MAG: ATP-binding protein [Myxococcales bacterium]
MLTSIQLDDWKSFGSGEQAHNLLTLAPLTLLVGPNASGKSNVLDALRFLQGAALDLPLADVLRGRWEGQREVWGGIRGHVVEAARSGTKSFQLVARWSVAASIAEHSLRVSTDGDVAVEQESLSEGDDYLFDTHAPALRGQSGRVDGGGLRVAYRGAGQGNRPTGTCSALKTVLVQLEKKERVAPEVFEVAGAVRSSLKGLVFLDIRPSLMRDYRPTKAGQLGTSGENVSPVLLALKNESPSRFEDVVDWLSELSAPALETIDFDVTRLDEVMLFFVEKGGRQVSARSASDGTLRFLGELVALLTCPEGSLIVLEEPDVGLHPSRIHLLAELLEDVARRRKLQILATTHSPTLLAHVSRESLGNAIAFGRNPESGWTVCSRFADLPHFDRLCDSKQMEHLVSTGWLERAL